MAKMLKNLGKTAKRAAIVAGTLLGIATAWGGYCQYIAKPETYIEYEIDKYQTEKVTIENKLIYTTQYGHKKVLLFMGGLFEREQGPGLNFRFPFETAYDVDVEKVTKLERGYRTKKVDVKTEYEIGDFSHESIMVTGDEGELEVQYVIQFRKKDPNQFLFNVKKPIATVSEVAEAALREVIANHTYNQALTIQREKIQDEATKLAQMVLDEYRTGVELIGILLQPIKPPTKDVQLAFDDINKAIQDKQTSIQEGMRQYEKAVREAAGQKQQLIDTAKGTAQEKINAAKGRVARYMEVLEGYKLAPEANRFRMHQEIIRKLMEKSKMTVIDPKTGGGLLQHIMIDKENNGGQK